MIKRIRPARHYQRADNPARLLMIEHKRKISRDMADAFKHLGDMLPTDRAQRYLRAGNYHALVREIDWNHFREVLKKTFSRIADAYTAGAQLGVRKINGSFARASRRVRFRKAADTFNFDLFTPDVQATLRDAQDALIQQLEADARDAIEVAVMDGATAGLSAADIVDNIRAVIGLTDNQAQAVLNFQNMLNTLDSGALTRQLRNTTYDQTVRDAIDSGEFLDADVIDQMVSDYAENYLDYRADTIAQTESARAINEGLHDAYSQAIERGALPDSAVTRQWQLGDSPCPICESIPDNNPDGVGVDETFDSDDGPVDDPPVHPNACFSGTLFVPYGSLKQIVRAHYKGPAIKLEAVLFKEDRSESAPRHAAVSRAMTQATTVSSQFHSDCDLLVRDSSRPSVSIIAHNVEITIGPNHPMLTLRGFIPAREIQEGDELLYDSRAQSTISSSKIDFKKMILFENAFSALADTFEIISPTGPRSYFHGDEVFTYGEVDVVFPKRDLLSILDSGPIKHLCECPLVGAYADAAHVASCSTCQKRFQFVFRSASGELSRTDDSFPLGFTEPLPSFFHSARIVSRHWGMFSGYAFDASTSDAIYNAGGFVVKNCMCSVDYVTDISQVPDDSEESGAYDTAGALADEFGP